VEAILKKVEGAKRRSGVSSQAGDRMSKRELLLAKPLKPIKKSAAIGTEAGKKVSAAKISSGLPSATKIPFGPPSASKSGQKMASWAPPTKTNLVMCHHTW
jgi:hypothetical protein